MRYLQVVRRLGAPGGYPLPGLPPAEESSLLPTVARHVPDALLQRHSHRLWREDAWRARWTSRATSTVVHLFALLTLPTCIGTAPTAIAEVRSIELVTLAPDELTASDAPTPTPTDVAAVEELSTEAPLPEGATATPPVGEPPVDATTEAGTTDLSDATSTLDDATANGTSTLDDATANGTSADDAATTTAVDDDDDDAMANDEPAADDDDDDAMANDEPAADDDDDDATAQSAASTEAPTATNTGADPDQAIPSDPNARTASAAPTDPKHRQQPHHDREPEEPEPGLGEWKKYVHTREGEIVPVGEGDGRYLSAHDAFAERDARTLITSPTEGPAQPVTADQVAAPWSPGLADPQQRPQDTRGDEMLAEATTARPPRPHAQEGDAPALAAAPPPPAGAPATTASAASATAGSSGASSALASTGTGESTAGGLRQAVAGTNGVGPDGREGWQPVVARIQIVAQSAAAAASASEPTAASTANPTREPTTHLTFDPAEDPTPTEPTEDPTDDPAEAAQPDPAIAATDAVAALDEVDPVDALRDALGWGRIDRTTLRQRNADVGEIGATASPDASEQTVLPDEHDRIGPLDVSTVGSPLGRYVAEIETIVRERWHQVDLDPLHRVLGVHGIATVQLYIHRTGRVTDIVLHASSGNPHLDAMALSAIPTTLPRIPREVDLEGLHHRISLRYRNQVAGPP
jgi:TonB family protein